MLRAHLNSRGSIMGVVVVVGGFLCVQDEEGVGCALVKWKLCGGNPRRLFFGAVRSHACIIYPFWRASMPPLSSELPHHIAPLLSRSPTNKTRDRTLTGFL